MKKIKKPAHGGTRKGSGRPAGKEGSQVLRVPDAVLEQVKSLILGIKDRKAEDR